MSIRNLDKIFKPQRVAVIGASNNPGSVGYTVLKNLIGSGFPGVVYPVNPRYEAIQGIHAYPDVRSLPRVPDLAIICTPAATVPELLHQCGEAGILGVIIISAGFKETGEEGRRLEERVKETIQKFDGMRVIGPNCLGVIVPALRLNASFAAAMPSDGHVAFISQSGALCTSVLDWAIEEGIGFSYFVSIGNMVDVTFGDLIDYFGGDERTRSIILYVESITEARRFMSAARAFSRTKPIVVYKAGRFAESARAASSHTGAMAGEDAVYDAAFRRAGAVRVYEIGEIFDTAELVARVRPPLGPRLAIVTNAGGPGVMATDALIARQGQLAELSPETMEKLNQILPAFWSHGNPVDVLGDASPERYAQALQVVLDDPQVDAVLVILTPQAMTDPTGTARAVAEVTRRSAKPVLAAWMGGTAVQEGIRILNQHGIPTYLTPDQAVQAFMHLVDYGRNLDLLYQTPREIPVEFTVNRSKIREDFLPLFQKEKILGERESKALLAAYGIPVTMPELARTEEEAVKIAHGLGFPVVMKIHSPDITHKTDVGGVVVGVLSEEGVRQAFRGILANVKERAANARIEGVTVQRMAPTGRGVEMILGAKKDPTFGAVIMIGAGGVTAEVLRDRALGLPPLNERLATHLLQSLRIWPLLQGYRGRPRMNVEKLLEVIMRFSYLVADFPEIQEIDVNPLVVTPEEVIAVDARVVVDEKALLTPQRSYSHLVIRPYPEGYERWVTLKDGTRVFLRPIRPEDEPLWHEMLAISSRESIRFRFRYIFKETTHQMAIPYCFIDYDREMAIVGIVEEDGRRRMVGVGRLIADPDRMNAEYAVFVADPWQNKGLGGILTDYALEIARSWGIRRVTAETTPDNIRMIRIFERRGFKLEYKTEESVILAAKPLE
ncbi:MAG: bifunctional acetate--CoA ligase family protein/GNAT family N-acetyltransferase [Candidatus Bipolaricaulota bacterium]|nr:bifunctional acetate--CoA ligase family protein/GNAT family N-acetyltransferase [Candidatus Bipolaricaulota bacterium]MDW8126353.1 bifunctional acetate--CoA ligase family protein/GNAT family N-acetyltransferase [Candidatus Bipolaricaulota bacterium]